MGDKRQDSRWKVAQESPGPIAFNVEGLSLTVGKKVLSRSDLKVRMPRENHYPAATCSSRPGLMLPGELPATTKWNCPQRDSQQR